MNRTPTLVAIGCAAVLAFLLAGCGSSQKNSAQTNSKDFYSVVVVPVRLTLNSGDWGPIGATVYLSQKNAVAKPISPQPAIVYTSSSPWVTVSPSGAVCAGLWDSSYRFCSATSALPTGTVTITATDSTHNVSGSMQITVHPRAASITLNGNSASTNAAAWPGSALPWPTGVNCISQNQQVQYVAQPVDANGNPIASCSLSLSAGCVYDNDYTWTSDNPSVATVSSYGNVVAHNPGVAHIYATLDGTVSAPLAFATCPPASIVLATSGYTGTTPTQASATNPTPFTTADLTSLQSSDQKYVTAYMTDAYGNPLTSTNVTFLSSDPLSGVFGPSLVLSYPYLDAGGQLTSAPETTSVLTAQNPGGFTMTASCPPPSCNPAEADFISPAGPTKASDVGFGYPVYSNAVAANVRGTAGSVVLVTGATAPDGSTPAHRLLLYNSESMALIKSISLPYVPNSLVVSPDGTTAYVGSDTAVGGIGAGLMVVDLTTDQATTQTYPVVGGQTNPPEVITGKVLGVSPDGRYVVVSDVANSLVYLIDTKQAKTATKYTIAGIDSVAFSLDSSKIRIGGSSGGTSDLYTFQADTFVPVLPTSSTNVTSLAWMPDGQSYFASGDQLVNYSACDDQNPQSFASPTSAVTNGLSAASVGGVTHLLGLSGAAGTYQWFDDSVNASSEVAQQTVAKIPDLTPGGTGNVCKSTVSIAAPATAASTLACTAEQIRFSPQLREAFVTGVDPSCGTAESVLHGYDLATQKEITLATTAPVVPLSGGILSDGRKLFFGTWDSAGQTAELHRIDLATGSGAPGTLAEDATPVAVSVVPSFVAVVPK